MSSAASLRWVAVLCLLCSGLPAVQAEAGAPHSSANAVCNPAKMGSPFLPDDSWVYPAVWRLYALGYVDSVYLGERPWTRARVAEMLQEAAPRIEAASDRDSAAQQAQGIYDALSRKLRLDMEGPCRRYRGNAQIESIYTIARGISGTPLRDSFHLGSTVINDYGRPYANGFNDYSGISGYATAGRFAFYVRGELEQAPSAAGYSPALYQQLATVDGTLNPVTNLAYPGQVTIPEGPISATADGRLLEAYISYQYLKHVFSFGKVDEWLSPNQGGSFAYSNNAADIYGFHINRIEPLRVPLLSWITGPFRYEFLIGALGGHTLMPNPLYPSQPMQPNVLSPGNPWVHLEKISFKPTPNVEFGFERTVIWGGEGHAPITVANFLRSFFSFSSPAESVKFGRTDPGARFGAFNASYRLPFLRHWLTFYTDGEVHDDVSPIDAPRRAAWSPGLYLSHVPGLPRLDVRAEAAMTDPAITNSTGGRFMYWEVLQRQGYTNQGQIFGHWIGREDKGGQAWFTYHLSGNEWVQVGYRRQKAAKDFIPGGTTLNDVNVQVLKRIGRNLELNANFDLEHWKAPIYLPGQQTVTATTVQLTWYPKHKVSF